MLVFLFKHSSILNNPFSKRLKWYNFIFPLAMKQNRCKMESNIDRNDNINVTLIVQIQILIYHKFNFERFAR